MPGCPGLRGDAVGLLLDDKGDALEQVCVGNLIPHVHLQSIRSPF